MFMCIMSVDELHPLLNHGLALLIGGMRLACNDKLHRMLLVEEYSKKPFRVVQQKVRPLISHKTAGEAKGQCVAIKNT